MAEFISYIRDFNYFSVFFRIGLAILLGALIGLERKRHGREAGVRTHAVVCLGSAMTVMVGLYSTTLLHLSGDPMRISAQVISGIGFLGAGTIITRNHSQITGLTTAAGLWATASIGLAVGIGFYSGALICFASLEMIIIIFSHKKYVSQTRNFYLELKNVESVNQFWEDTRRYQSSMQLVPPESGNVSHVGVAISIRSCKEAEALLLELRELENVVFVLPQRS